MVILAQRTGNRLIGKCCRAVVTTALTGMATAADLIKNLKRDENGNMIETVKVVSHSMGGVYAEGYIQGLLKYGAEHPEVGKFTIESDVRLASFQPENQSAVGDVPLYQYSNQGDKVAGSGGVEGLPSYYNFKGSRPGSNGIPNAQFNIINPDTKKEHDLFDFENRVDELPKSGNILPTTPK
ncbi:MAG: hypothetical protein JST20_11120 [Bacteroidetes bacterium]|nr:hypothetical protein [Bacteroidota bacterium]